MFGFQTNLSQPLRWRKLSDRQRLTLYDLMLAAWHRQGLPDNVEGAAEAISAKPEAVKAVWLHFRTACEVRDGKMMFPEMWEAIDRQKSFSVRNAKAGQRSAEARAAKAEVATSELKDLAEHLVDQSVNGHKPQDAPDVDIVAMKAKELQQQCVAVFDYWREKTGHQGALFSPDRQRKIQARLRDGFSLQQLKQAIDGCCLSPFHQGENETGTKYDQLELILRNASHVERFIAQASATTERKAAFVKSLGAQFVSAVCGFDFALLQKTGGKQLATVLNTGKWIDERYVRLVEKMPDFQLDPDLFSHFWEKVLNLSAKPRPESVPRYFSEFVEWQRK